MRAPFYYHGLNRPFLLRKSGTQNLSFSGKKVQFNINEEKSIETSVFVISRKVMPLFGFAFRHVENERVTFWGFMLIIFQSDKIHLNKFWREEILRIGKKLGVIFADS